MDFYILVSIALLRPLFLTLDMVFTAFHVFPFLLLIRSCIATHILVCTCIPAFHSIWTITLSKMMALCMDLWTRTTLSGNAHRRHKSLSSLVTVDLAGLYFFNTLAPKHAFLTPAMAWPPLSKFCGALVVLTLGCKRFPHLFPW